MIYLFNKPKTWFNCLFSPNIVSNNNMEALFSFALDLGKDLWTKRMNNNRVTSSEAWDVMMKVPYGKSVSIVNSNPPCSLAGINFELLQLTRFLGLHWLRL